MHFLRSFLRRPHTERISDGVLKMFRRNRNRDSCEKNTTGTEYTGIRRIPAGLGNLAIRSGCRISLCRSSDWHLRHSRVLAADLRLFSFSRNVDTAFAATLLALALVIPMIQTYKTPLLQRSVAEEDRMPKRFWNYDMVWIILRCKTQTWKFMGCGRLPGKRIVSCSASKVTKCSSVYQSSQVVVNSMLRQQGDTTLIIYQSCQAIVKQGDIHYTWLTLLWFYLRIGLSPSWVLPIAANVFPASVPKKWAISGKMKTTVTFSSTCYPYRHLLPIAQPYIPYTEVFHI
jgi:hypothetical protein